MSRRAHPLPGQRGIALPIMLIMLTVMMVSSIYLLRATTSSTLTTANLAYESEQARAADAGLHAGFAFLRNAASQDLLTNQSAGGYVATMTESWTVSTPAFWQGSLTMPLDASLNRVEYVIHRLCSMTGDYSVAPNRCRTTAPRPTVAGAVALGSSLALGNSKLGTTAQIHYLVTARVFGPRGGNVVTQAVVMKGP